MASIQLWDLSKDFEREAKPETRAPNFCFQVSDWWPGHKSLQSELLEGYEENDNLLVVWTFLFCTLVPVAPLPARGRTEQKVTAYDPSLPGKPRQPLAREPPRRRRTSKSFSPQPYIETNLLGKGSQGNWQEPNKGLWKQCFSIWKINHVFKCINSVGK